MLTLLPLMFALQTPAAASSAAASSTAPSIAVLALRPASKADEPLARLLSAALTEGVATAAKGSRVLSEAELKVLLNVEATKQLMGCNDESCVADLSKALKTDRVVSGEVGVVGSEAMVFLSLIDPQQVAVIARASRVVPAKDSAAVIAAVQGAGASLAGETTMVRALNAAALALFDPEAGKAGDDPLVDLRVGVVIDEVDQAGTALITRPVETCVGKVLADKDANVVDAAVIATLKGKTAPRELLQGRIPEGFGADEVDALVIGVVQTRAATTPLSTWSGEADGSVRVVRVDTGDVLASEQVHTRFPAHSQNEAEKGAAARLCDKLMPAVEAAMQRRAARGVRVVVEVQGALGPEGLKDLLSSLEKVRRVVKVKPRTLGKDKSVLDVTVRGGDAVSFALDAGAAFTGFTPTTTPAGVKLARLP